MKIGFLSGHACVRCQKMALPLIEAGHEVHLVARKTPSFVERYTSFSKYHDLGQLIELVKVMARSVDIFHAHNEPSWFVTIVKENTDVPVILDVHDSFAARMTDEEEERLRAEGKEAYRITVEERNNFQAADGLVYPGAVFGKIVSDEFALTQPSLVLESMLPRGMFNYNPQQWYGGLVYEGKVDLPKDYESNPMGHGFKYCNYQQLAQKAHDLGIDFHLYTIREDEPFKKVYDEILIRHAPRDITGVVKSIGRHDWGLVGNIFPTAEWDVAMPNKLFEYIAASVPIVAINAKACSELIEEHGIGITVDSLEELRDRWAEHRECRNRLIKCRQEFTMERHIHKLVNLYETVLGQAKSIWNSQEIHEIFHMYTGKQA